MTRNVTLSMLAALTAMTITLSGCGSPAVVPQSYSTYKAEDGSFKIDYPEEWKAEGGGRSGYAWAKFTSGNAEIKVDTSTVGSIMADIAKVPTHNDTVGGETIDEERAPVAIVHENEKEDFEEEAGVTEQKAELAKTGLLDARKAQFTGQNTFGGSTHGYRVTALSSQKRIRVVCQCPEGEWESLKPAFDKIIESLSQGR